MVLHSGYEKVAHLYDLFDSKDNIDFFAEYGVRAGEVLDIGAGTGRIAIPMAERGARVWCVEPSPAMLREFRLKLKGKPDLSPRLTLIEADACGFRLGHVFPTAVMSGCFDHLMDEKERTKALANIAEHLEPGGRLVFDVFLGLMDDSPLKAAGEKKVSGKIYRRFLRRKVLPNRTIELLLVFETVEDGRLTERIEQTSSAAVIDRALVHHVLECAGFRVARELGGYGSAPYRDGDGILVVEAVKCLPGSPQTGTSGLNPSRFV
jgi:SAM-dependent methyltransferase